MDNNSFEQKDSNAIVTFNSVHKNYKGFKALNDVSFTLEQGKVYGLIGQNGAGKTTIMRIICGFSFPSEGSIELFGQNTSSGIDKARNSIGCMIENPGLIPSMNAKDNLHYHRLLRHVKDDTMEDKLLDMVGLKDTGNKKAKDFSLGMKQRLGIAIALLGNPKLLVLDEPINGLDPVGILEIRELIKKLNKELNITVLISSHNLPELFQTATDYIFIHKGQVIKTLTLPELEEKCSHRLTIRCKDNQALCEMFNEKLDVNNYKIIGDEVRVYDVEDCVENIAKVMFDNGFYATHFAIEGDTLEEYFLSMIGGK